MKRINLYISIILLIAALMICLPISALAAEAPYDQVAPSQAKLEPEDVTQYGMLPIYGRDVADGTYSVEVKSSSSMFRIVDARLTVNGEEMEAAITLSGQGYLKLFMGTGEEAAASDGTLFIGYTEGEDGLYTYTVPVEALNKALPCTAFSKRKEQWYDRLILFQASSLPEEALLVELPDYDAIEAAMKGQSGNASSAAQPSGETAGAEMAAVEPMRLDMEDGEYAIEVDIAGGSGKASVSSPTILKVENGKAYAQLVWSSSNYDYMIVGTEKYLNTNTEDGNSTFEIPIAVMDAEMPVIADTTAMGTPHEVAYTLTFYRESITDKSQMPQEAAKRVVVIALIIIVGGGILNHILAKRRRA